VLARLDAIGDSTWLRSRVVVITFEESWPLAGAISIDKELASKLAILTSVARAAKQKDAAGLGTLAHAYAEGDGSTLDDAPDPRMIRLVAAALERPPAFFTWAFEQSRSEDSTAIIRSAQRYLSVATWPWDKAFILAGALLAAVGNTPMTPVSTPGATEQDFPYWVALDKHTDEGKVALKETSSELGVRYRQLIWASFYCESVRVNELLPSPWFRAERTWRLNKAGLSNELAEQIWERARPLLIARLADEARSLRELVESPIPARTVTRQASLL